MDISSAQRVALVAMKHPWRVILVCLLLIILSASGARFLMPASDYRVFFRNDNPQLLAYEDLRAHFTSNDNILLAIAPADGKVFTRDHLDLIAETTERLWQMPYVIRVDSITNFQHSHAIGDELIIEDMYDPDIASDKDISGLKEIVLAQPELVNKLITEKADISGINISILLPGKNPMVETPEIVNAVRQLASQIEQQHPGVKTWLTGVIMLNNAFAEVSMVDMATLIPAVFLSVLLLLWIILKSGWAIVATLLVIFSSILTAMGSAGWMSYPMTPPMAVVPIIILTLTVAHCVHLLIPTLKAMAKGADKQDAFLTSVKYNIYPIFLTSITTASGFLALNSTEVLPFHHLGNSAALGVTVAFLFSITLLPALLSLLPLKARPGSAKSGAIMTSIAHWVIAKQATLLVVMLLLAVSCVAMIPKNIINENLIKYFDTSITFRTDSDHIAENLTGVGFVDYSFDTKAQGVQEPKFLQEVEQFSDWLKEQPEVLSVNTITDTLKRLNQNMHADQSEYYRLPEKKDQAAQYLLLYEISLPYGLDINNRVNIDKSATRISVAVKNMDAIDYIEFDERAMQWLQEKMPHHLVMGSSPTMMFAHISMNNASAILLSTSLALSGISIILILALRSIKLGLLSLIPNLLPIAAAFGLWGLFNGEIGLGLSLVAATTLGIIVDDTVHFLHKYRYAKQQEKSNPGAVEYAFNQVGPALMTTSVALIAGFLILSLSVFKLNADMGILTAVTLALALAFDFLLLPALLLLNNKKI